MKVLSFYNRYVKRGGEDTVFETEAALLRERGHDVLAVTAEAPQPTSLAEQAHAAADAVWNPEWNRRLAARLREFRPDVVHVHNTFPTASPSILRTAHRSGVPVVHTLHNYRLGCARATFFRDGAVCEDCLGRSLPLPALRHACFHDSRKETGVVALTTVLHRALRTWSGHVDAYIVLSEFAREKFVEIGLPPSRLHVKGNTLPRGLPTASGPGDHLLFVGRLSHEKGVDVLLRAAETLPEVPLRVVGDGPLEDAVAASARRLPNLTYVGRLDQAGVWREMAACRALVFPSIWQEPFSLVVLEANAIGRPAIASAVGALPEILDGGTHSWLVEPGDAAELAAGMRAAWNDPATAQRHGRDAAARARDRCDPDRNVRRLEDVYESARGAGLWRVRPGSHRG